MSRVGIDCKMRMTKKQRKRNQRRKWDKKRKRLSVSCECENVYPIVMQSGHFYDGRYPTTSYHIKCRHCGLTIRRRDMETCFKLVQHDPELLKYIPGQFQQEPEFILARKLS